VLCLLVQRLRAQDNHRAALQRIRLLAAKEQGLAWHINLHKGVAKAPLCNLILIQLVLHAISRVERKSRLQNCLHLINDLFQVLGIRIDPYNLETVPRSLFQNSTKLCSQISQVAIIFVGLNVISAFDNALHGNRRVYIEVKDRETPLAPKEQTHQ
jgi:hypothetical protein